MGHDPENTEAGLLGGKVFDSVRLDGSMDFSPTPDLISKPLENPGSGMVPSPHPYTDAATPVPTLKNFDRIPDELLIRTWLAGKSKNTRRAYSRISDELLSWIHPVGLKGTTIHLIQSFVEGRSGWKVSPNYQAVFRLRS